MEIDYEYDSKGIGTNELCASPANRGDGRRHAGYGVNDHDYETVGEALLWTLEQGLGPSFTPEVREAWTTLYRLVADTMRMAGNDMVAQGAPAVA
jgi:hemoglobin-like flavoprotein